MGHIVDTSLPRDLSGQKLGRWLVIKRNGISTSRNALWLCECECGTRRNVSASALRNGASSSCGCLQKEKSAEHIRLVKLSHGMSKTTEYQSWCGIKSRCFLPTSPAYDRYGGRGITVCDRWVNSFENFLADMGPSPSEDHSIDRINNDGDYEPGNCRWATRREQARNTRANRLIEHAGETKTIAEWCDIYQMGPATVWGRLERGWEPSRALTTPARRWGRTKPKPP